MWKQGKQQPNRFAPNKQQNNNNYRRNNKQNGDQNRQNRGNHTVKRTQNYNRNSTIDSQGPDVKVRGTLSQLTEKYTSLSRDATHSGDRVLAENLLQHAEHYTRILLELTPPAPKQPEKSEELDLSQQPQPSLEAPKPVEQEPATAKVEPIKKVEKSEKKPAPKTTSSREPTPIADVVITPVKTKKIAPKVQKTENKTAI